MASVYRKKDDLLTRRIAGETLVVPIRGKLADMQSIFALSEVGEFVWERLDGKTNVEAILDAVVEQFEVDEGQVQADVAEFLGELFAAGLIERV
jgi:hypothetical protein